MSKTKVLHISRGFNDYVIELLNSLPPRVEVCHVLSQSDAWMTSALIPEVQVFDSKAPRVSSLGNLFAMIRLLRFVQKYRPDIIHMQNGVIWELILMWVFPEIPLVITVHDITRHPSHHGFLFTPQGILDFAVKRANGIIVHSQKLKNYAIEYYGYRLQNFPLFVIPHGVLQRYGCGRAAINPNNRVLFFGTVDKWKGLEYLLKAAPAIKSQIPDIEIKVAGHCRQPECYQDLVKDLDYVVLNFGYQDNATVTDLFEWADVLVLPYIEASQSGVLHLGLSFSIPCVVTDVGGLPDVIENEVNGLVIQAKDSESIADAVIRLLKDQSLRKNIIAQLDQDKTGRFGREAIAEMTCAAYQAVIDG